AGACAPDGAGQERLGYGLRGRGQRGGHAVQSRTCSEAERRDGCSSGSAEALVTCLCVGCVDRPLAGDRLQQTWRQERSKDVDDTVHPAVGKPPAAPYYGLVVAKNGLQKAAVEVRVPGCGNARADATVKRLVGILRLAIHISD